MNKLSRQRRIKSILMVTIGGITGYAGINIYKGNQQFYSNYVMPIVRLLDPEDAHNLAVVTSKYRLFPKSHFEDNDILKVRLFNKQFPNPIGIAAGFDKGGEAVEGLQDLGFGFIEIGSVTPEPQPGNEKPRIFRLPEDLAVINRYGFNSEGHEVVLKRLKRLRNANFSGIIGVNLGKNKTSPNAINDYLVGIEKFGPVADYLVINISSPNTPGLRAMQNVEVLRDLLKAVVEAKEKLPQKTPLFLKLAPDLTPEERHDIAGVLERNDCRIDGLIISNTTIQRPQFLINKIRETGGLSGQPLKDLSTQMIADMYKLTDGKIPIIGVGGIFSGQDAYEKIRAGANIVQIYTAIVYEGPTIVTKIKQELQQLLIRDGFHNVSEAVGKDVK